ncbi:hypothetical protein ACFUC1_09040 [Pedococcus sp. NPDC057267]|uniref:hypothetical protein n=1 Tax=Pedococcus sp. NPDC057267 TaxID=3346077 RepID=UPI0036320634
MQSATQGPGGALQRAVVDTLAEATGRESRDNPVLAGTGGPAGNALLTAWTALVLLALSVAELLTLFDVRGLISWHVALGALLIPPAVMKTASTGWRMASYYLGRKPYEVAGPPPLLMRLLGPLVVVSTLGLLASGVLLILLGEEEARRASLTVLGFRADWVTVHQGFFAVWAVAAGLHLLGRVVPALQATVMRRLGGGRAVPGRWARVLWFTVMVVGAAALAVVLVHADSSWAAHGFGDRPGIRPEDG